jgi:hypothetical protein
VDYAPRWLPRRCWSDGGGIDGGQGGYFANQGEDVHTVGSLDPVIEGAIGLTVIQPDGSRYLARVVPDPLARHGQ